MMHCESKPPEEKPTDEEAAPDTAGTEPQAKATTTNVTGGKAWGGRKEKDEGVEWGTGS